MEYFEVSKILKRLDTAEKAGRFPPIQMEEYYNAGVKLKVFLSDSQWLILLESLDFTERGYMFINQINAFGNDLEEEGLYVLTEIIEECPNIPFFSEESYNDFLLDPFDFKIMIKGQQMHFKFSEADYSSAGVDLSDTRVPMPAKILRVLVQSIPDRLFFSNEDLLIKCGKENSGLELFLEIKEWFHPDIINKRDSVVENPCLKSLAQAIAVRNANVYNCPANLFNSHWTNWE